MLVQPINSLEPEAAVANQSSIITGLLSNSPSNHFILNCGIISHDEKYITPQLDCGRHNGQSRIDQSVLIL